MRLADVFAELAGHAAGGHAVAFAIFVDGGGIAGATVVDDDLAAQMQFAVVEQRIRAVDAPAQLGETPLLRLEKMYRAFPPPARRNAACAAVPRIAG
jgi:hypothetical protein